MTTSWQTISVLSMIDVKQYTYILCSIFKRLWFIVIYEDMLLDRSILLKEGESTEMPSDGRKNGTLVKYSQNEQQLLKKRKDSLYFIVISAFKFQMFPPYGLVELYIVLEHLMAIKHRSDAKV